MFTVGSDLGLGRSNRVTDGNICWLAGPKEQYNADIQSKSHQNWWCHPLSCGTQHKTEKNTPSHYEHMLICQRHWCTWIKCNKSRLLPYIWFEFAIRIQPSYELKDRIFLPTQPVSFGKFCSFVDRIPSRILLAGSGRRPAALATSKARLHHWPARRGMRRSWFHPARLFAHFCTVRHCLCQMSVKSVGIVLTISSLTYLDFDLKVSSYWTSHNFSTGVDSKHPRHPGREFCSLEGCSATTCWKYSSLKLIKASRRDKVLVSL